MQILASKNFSRNTDENFFRDDHISISSVFPQFKSSSFHEKILSANIFKTLRSLLKFTMVTYKYLDSLQGNRLWGHNTNPKDRMIIFKFYHQPWFVFSQGSETGIGITINHTVLCLASSIVISWGRGYFHVCRHVLIADAY